MEDLLYAAIVGIQIAEVIGAPKMYELLIQHEFQIISHMGGAKQLPHKSLRISLSCLQVSEKLSTIIPLLSVERRDEVLEVLEDLIRKVVSREVARVSGSVTKIDLERERICDLLEFLQNRSEVGSLPTMVAEFPSDLSTSGTSCGRSQQSSCSSGSEWTP